MISNSEISGQFFDQPMKAPPGTRSTRTVLYVEDDETDAALLRRAFDRECAGVSLCVVETARLAMDYLSGATCLERREGYPLPEMVLLDLNLQGMSGLELLAWIRLQSGLRRLPVVALSGSTAPEARAWAEQLAATDYWEKPGSFAGLRALVRQMRERWGLGQPPDGNATRKPRPRRRLRGARAGT